MDEGYCRCVLPNWGVPARYTPFGGHVRVGSFSSDRHAPGGRGSPIAPVFVERANVAPNPEIASNRKGRCYLCKSKQQSVRLLPTHRDAMAVAPVGVIVPQRMVLRAAVVPKCNRIRRPFEAHAQLRGLNVPIEHFENRVA